MRNNHILSFLLVASLCFVQTHAASQPRTLRQETGSGPPLPPGGCMLNADGDVCCNPSCAVCGGRMCGSGGLRGAQCCGRWIRRVGQPCSATNPAPCLLLPEATLPPMPELCMLNSMGDVCCQADCPVCGGRGCSRGGRRRDCCVRSIRKNLRSCAFFRPPCINPSIAVATPPPVPTPFSCSSVIEDGAECSTDSQCPSGSGCCLSRCTRMVSLTIRSVIDDVGTLYVCGQQVGGSGITDQEVTYNGPCGDIYADTQNTGGVSGLLLSVIDNEAQIRYVSGVALPGISMFSPPTGFFLNNGDLCMWSAVQASEVLLTNLVVPIQETGAVPVEDVEDTFQLGQFGYRFHPSFC